MTHRMTWSHCGLEYHIHISADAQDSGGYLLQICDEAFSQAPFRIRLPSVREALENAVLFIFADVPPEQQEQLLETLVADDDALLHLAA